MRLGPGPVFAWHAARLARRRSHYWLRVAVPATLLAALAYSWAREIPGGDFVPIDQWASMAQGIFSLLLGWQLFAVLLIAPALVAGAFGADKARGTLGHLLVTDLSGAEVAAGTLLAQVIPVLAIVAAGAPVLAIVALFGGISPEMFALGYAGTLGGVLMACAFSSLCALWGRRVRDAMLASYMILAAWMIADILRDMLRNSWPGLVGPRWVGLNPVAAVVDLASPEGRLSALIHFAAGVLAMAIVALIASWRLRPIVLRQTFGVAGRGRMGLSARLRRLAAPEPWPNPVLWRQWIRHGGSLGNRWAMRAYLALSGLLVGIGIAELARGGFLSGLPMTLGGAFLVSLGMLLLAVSATATLSEDRARGLLDALLVTPLPSSTIASGYWLGAAAAFPWVALPGVASAVALGWGERWGLGILASLLASGLLAAFTIGIGLRRALRFERIGRAVAGSVGIFLALCVALPVAAFLLVPLLGRDRGEQEAFALSLGSPFIASTASFAASSAEWRPSDEPAIPLGVLSWAIILGVASWRLAAGLPAALERHLGRMPDAGERPSTAAGPG